MVLTESLFDALEQQHKSAPDNIALIYEDEICTYGQLYSRVSSIAEQLRELEIEKGDKVALLFPNHPEFVAAFFAVIGLGAVVVPVNPLLKSEEIAHILVDSNARMLIVHSSGLAEALSALSSGTGSAGGAVSSPAGTENEEKSESRTKAARLRTIIVSPDLPSSMDFSASESTQHSCFDGRSVIGLTAKPGPREEQAFNVEIQNDKDLAVIVYTSGTTGKPKGAMLSHLNIISALKESLFADFNIQSSDRFLGVLPLCHIYGIGVLAYFNTVRGSSLVILPKFEAKKVLELIEKHRVTILPLVPTMYQFLLMEMQEKPYDLSSLRYPICAAAPLSAELQDQVGSKIGVKIVEGYGSSETACGGTVNPPDACRTGSVGKPISCLELAIRADDGKFLSRGIENVGEIVLRGPNIMLGYHEKPEATAEAFVEGAWFLTGDLGYQDEDGYVYIVGRKKELIIRGGSNIYPREVEELILRMPEVSEVAVIGVPDKLMGERVKAVIVPTRGAQLSEEQVKEFCDKHLAQYKVPRLVEFRSSLPRNSTGKILKRELS